MKFKIFTLLVLIQAVTIPSAIAQNIGTARILRPLELRGSKEQRIEQNIKANNLNIVRIATRAKLETLVSGGVLIELTDSNFYYIDPKPERICMPDARGRRRTKSAKRHIFVYPAVKQYLDWRAGEYFAEFHMKWKITSGARSLEEQILMRTPGSCYYTPAAALADDPLEESLHVRGIAVDVSRKGMKAKKIKWMREKLVMDKISGVEFEIDPIEESICYHIVVFPKTLF